MTTQRPIDDRPRGCARCGHPAAAHYPDGCARSIWGGVCKAGCRLFVWPPTGDLYQVPIPARPSCRLCTADLAAGAPTDHRHESGSWEAAQGVTESELRALDGDR